MKAANSILIFLLSFLMFACNSTDMTTVISADGSCERIFTQNVDSAFITGDVSNNPFPVELDSNWKIQWKYLADELHTEWPLKQWQWAATDSNQQIVATAKRHFNSVNDLSAFFQFKKEHPWKDLKIKASLNKKFGWFYTCYDYEEVFPKLPLQLPVPLEKYLSKDEIHFWLKGDPKILNGLNGMEINEITKDIETKFNHWLLETNWNFIFNALLERLDLFPGNPGREKLLTEKDSIFSTIAKTNINDIYSMSFGDILNKHFHTSAFNRLKNENDNQMKQVLEGGPVQQFLKYEEGALNYKLLMPGKLLQTNGSINTDTISWKVNAYRMLDDAYKINASSRKLNLWAVIVSLVIVCSAIIFTIKTQK